MPATSSNFGQLRNCIIRVPYAPTIGGQPLHGRCRRLLDLGRSTIGRKKRGSWIWNLNTCTYIYIYVDCIYSTYIHTYTDRQTDRQTYMSTYLSICLFIFLSTYLSIYPSIYLSMCSVYVCLWPEVWLWPLRNTGSTVWWCPQGIHIQTTMGVW